MPTIDEQIGKNVSRLRGAMSQRDLADEMKLRGWRWTHVTVGSVERGERPLRAAESLGLAEIFDRDVTDIVTSQEEARILSARSRVSRAWPHLQQAMMHWDDSRVELAVLEDRKASISEFADTPRDEEGQFDALTLLTVGEVWLGVRLLNRPKILKELLGESTPGPRLNELLERERAQDVKRSEAP